MVDDDGVAVAAAKALGQQHMAAGGHDHRILRLLRLDDDICRGAPAVAVVRAALAVGTAIALMMQPSTIIIQPRKGYLKRKILRVMNSGYNPKL